jgi:diguanylate cyclase (GGDEF)-like protein
MKRLENEVNRGRRYKSRFSLIMLDIDHFKDYNDRLGHPKGNNLLCAISRLFQQHCREVDIIARYGGDELAIIMPETTAEIAFRVINRIREQIAIYPFEGLSGQPHSRVTISAGVANYPLHGTNPQLLIGNADRALYQAKGLGRNLVMISPEEGADHANNEKK